MNGLIKQVKSTLKCQRPSKIIKKIMRKNELIKLISFFVHKTR